MKESAKLLPPDAVKILQKAAATQVYAGGDKNARTKAIEQATEKVKRMYPHLFR